MATDDTTPYVEDVDNDGLSLSTHSINSITEPIDLRTPDGSENAASNATTIPLQETDIHRQNFVALTAEMRYSSQAIHSLLRELINVSTVQHQYTTNALNGIANQIGHQHSSRPLGTDNSPLRTDAREFKPKRPIDVSDPPADPKSASTTNRKSADRNIPDSSDPDFILFDQSRPAAKTIPNPLQKSSPKASRRFVHESDSDQDEDADTSNQAKAKSSTSSTHTGLGQFDELVSDRKAVLTNATDRYRHVSTVFAQIDDTKFTISTNSVAAVIVWYSALLKYAHVGGTKFYCDLISPNVAEEIQRKNGITREEFHKLNNPDAVDHLFALVRPTTSLEWTRLFKNNLQYPTGYSATFLLNQTVLMKLTDLSRFVNATIDLVFVLGSASSPSDRDVRKTFENLLPLPIRDMIRDYSIDPSYPFLQFLSRLKDKIAHSSEIIRRAAPLTQHLQTSPGGSSPFRANVMRAPPAAMSDPQHVLFQRPERQVRASTYEQRARFNVLTADDIYGPGDEDPEDYLEPPMSAYENQLLEEHGIFTYTAPAPVTPTKYAGIKKELDYPPHLRFPEGPRPCWTFYNTGTCAQQPGCPYEHEVDRIEKHIAIKRQREAFMPSKPTK